MERHRFLVGSMAVLIAFSLAATPVLASLERGQFLVFLPGINGNGTLNFNGDAEEDQNQDGDFVVVTALINTYNGKFYFKTCGCVVNESRYCQRYSNENFFIQDLTDGGDVSICTSCYSVSWPYRCISRVTYVGFATDSDDAP